MKYLLEIKVDENDADYVTETTDVTEGIDVIRALLSRVLPSLEVTNSWPNREYVDITVQELHPDLSDEDIDEFQSYCPGREHGFHTIESIKLYHVAKIESLL